jgi:hypothetical protein
VLHIYESYGSVGLVGSVSFKNVAGEVKLNLTQEQVQGIIELCAEAIVESAKATANLMVTDVIEHLPNKELT